jgi:hypothetical protein
MELVGCWAKSFNAKLFKPLTPIMNHYNLDFTTSGALNLDLSSPIAPRLIDTIHDGREEL